MRIAGVTIPDNKQLAYSLPLIFGIGPTRAREILKQVGVSPVKKGGEITSDEEQKNPLTRRRIHHRGRIAPRDWTEHQAFEGHQVETRRSSRTGYASSRSAHQDQFTHAPWQCEEDDDLWSPHASKNIIYYGKKRIIQEEYRDRTERTRLCQRRRNTTEGYFTLTRRLITPKQFLPTKGNAIVSSRRGRAWFLRCTQRTRYAAAKVGEFLGEKGMMLGLEATVIIRKVLVPGARQSYRAFRQGRSIKSLRCTQVDPDSAQWPAPAEDEDMIGLLRFDGPYPRLLPERRQTYAHSPARACQKTCPDKDVTPVRKSGAGHSISNSLRS